VSTLLSVATGKRDVHHADVQLVTLLERVDPKPLRVEELPALAAVISRVRLDREITHEEAYNAGLHHIEQTLNLRQNADYSWRGSLINPKRPGCSIFNYSYKA
jgi:hypothetical protein